MRRRGDRLLGRRVHGGVLLVPCLLNDAYRYWFLADTGAARTLLTRTVAEEIGLDPAAPIRHERIASVHHVTGVSVARLSSLQVGAQRLTEVEVLLMALPTDLRIDGLLGLNVLGRFRATFELHQATLVLR
jgi:predicted aspartyl protease